MADRQWQVGQLQAELTESRWQVNHQALDLANRSSLSETLLAEKTTIAAERDRMALQLAAANGRLEGLQAALGTQEARANTAEARLTAMTNERPEKKAPRKRQS